MPSAVVELQVDVGVGHVLHVQERITCTARNGVRLSHTEGQSGNVRAGPEGQWKALRTSATRRDSLISTDTSTTTPRAA